MEEFRLPYLVSELIKVLGIKEKISEEVSCDAYVEHLKKNQTPYIRQPARTVSQSALKKLSSRSPDASAVEQKYEDLKARNIRILDPFVHLLCEISSDDKVKNFFKRVPQNTEIAKRTSSLGKEDSKDGNAEVSNPLRSHNKLISDFVVSYHVETKKKSSTASGVHKFPKWMRERNYLSWNFVLTPRIDNIKVGPIGVLPKSTQEHLLINDLLFCFSGVEGDYITVQQLYEASDAKVFVVDDSTDGGLLQLTEKFLPVLSDYSVITRFIEERSHFEYGLVNHALCAAIRDMIQDYFILIAQLEHQHLSNSLSLQKMWFYLQPAMLKLQVIADICVSLDKGECFGGMVLSVLHEKAFSQTGDAASQEICYHLAKSASVPYFEILEKWIYKGMISDPYSEFLVEDNELIKKDDLPIEYSDDYWEKRYIIRREQIPIFLEKVTDIILRTGKYLNVIRQCGHNIKVPDSQPFTYMSKEQFYFEKIYKAYQFASKKLLDLLMTDNDFKGRLRSVKHYFLLDQSDFIVQFMDMAEEELSKDIDDIMPTRLESLLELALRTSAVNCDKYKDDVKVELLPYDLGTQLSRILTISPEDQNGHGSIPDKPITGLEALSFDYEVKWPLSLVINRRSLACYQMLFRHLFYCKYVEGLLGRVWTLNKLAKLYPISVYASYSSAFALRQRMLHFIQNLDYYITLEVIEPHWENFRRKMFQVSNVDDVIECHTDFLTNCLTDCMLTFKDLLQVLVKLLKLCVAFSAFMQETHGFAAEAEFSSMGDNLLLPVFEESIYKDGFGNDASHQSTFQQRIEEFQKEFDSLFIQLLEMIADLNVSKSSTKMSNMLHRLDFSGFYARNNESLQRKLNFKM